VILARAILHQTVRFDGVITKGGGAVETALLDRDFVDFTRRIPEIRFEGAPIGSLETGEQNAEAVIRTFLGTKGVPKDPSFA